MDYLVAILLVCGVLGLIAYLMVSTIKASRARIRQWAAKNGYTILEMQIRFIRRGPFFFKSTKAQSVYYVIIEDKNVKKEAFIKMGKATIGLFSNQFQVEWVETESKKASS